MSNEKIETSNDTLLIKFGNGVISFIVGLSAFYVIKLMFMFPVNLMATPENYDTIKSVASVLIILSIYLAVKYTKELNRNGTKKSRNIKRIATIILGFICMIATIALPAISRAYQTWIS